MPAARERTPSEPALLLPFPLLLNLSVLDISRSRLSMGFIQASLCTGVADPYLPFAAQDSRYLGRVRCWSTLLSRSSLRQQSARCQSLLPVVQEHARIPRSHLRRPWRFLANTLFNEPRRSAITRMAPHCIRSHQAPSSIRQVLPCSVRQGQVQSHRLGWLV